MKTANCKLQIVVAIRRAGRRSGLSTLELVLCLPILLFLMALMINFGTVACWKVRSLSVARQMAWASRFPRTNNNRPRPDYWPVTAGVSIDAEEDAPLLDDPRVHQPVARGPLPFGAVVNERLLDPTRGFRQGSASLDRHFPLLRKMGEYRLEATTRLLDDKWQYRQMGLSSNRQRRIPVIYALAKAPQGMVHAYLQAASALLGAPFQPQLQPLDNDDEFLYYQGHAPDFHPRLRRFDSLDLELAARRVAELIDRIQGGVKRDAGGNVERKIRGVPENMTRAFIRLYQNVINQLKSQPGPGSPQGNISELERRVEILRQFLATLQSNDGN